ncbi:MAG TPA: DUF1573 domain-containing protein [Sediminibacterium sp.]|jgi:hypothetical protein|nr:DUF1573 domain-containing protein [Sediminibacterium sp.]
MKNVLSIFVAALAFLACNNADQKTPLPGAVNTEALKDSANFTSIQWIDSTDRDLGKVTEGEQVEVTYRFKNTGTKPLIISRVSASCGCTVPETPQEPFAPGAEGVIKAKFNSSGRVGTNHKEVYVMANTKPSTLNQLEFSIQVEPKDQ